MNERIFSALVGTFVLGGVPLLLLRFIETLYKRSDLTETERSKYFIYFVLILMFISMCLLGLLKNIEGLT